MIGQTAPTNPVDSFVQTIAGMQQRIADLERAVRTLQPRRNLLDNGVPIQHLRGGSNAGITAGGYYTADRWKLALSALGTWTQSIESDVPASLGFARSLKMLCTTADASPAATDVLLLAQHIENRTSVVLYKGTANARPITLSFWVKANKTGTYVAELADLAATTRLVNRTYAINTADTWEFKVISFPNETSSPLPIDNDGQLLLQFWLGAGSNYMSGSIQSGWHTTDANRAPGQVNLASATNQYWMVTGVQLEASAVPTPFEHLRVHEVDMVCRRYFQRWTQPPLRGVINSATSAGRMAMPFPVTMRGIPAATLSASGVIGVYDGSTISTISSIATNYSTANTAELELTTPNVWGTMGRAAVVYQSGTGYVDFSAEF